MAPGPPPMMAMQMQMQPTAVPMPMQLVPAGAGTTPGQLPPVMAQVISSPAMATVGVDVNRDGRPDIIVSGQDQNRDGIPDALEQGAPQVRPAGSSRWSIDAGAGARSSQVLGMAGAPRLQGAPAVPSYAPAPVVYSQGAEYVTARPSESLSQNRSYVPPAQLSYAPGPQLVRVPSFVAPPLQQVQQIQGASFVAQPPPGQQPVEGTLTKGMPDPTAIDQQRNAYSKALDLELQKSIQSIQEKNAMEKKMLAQAAQQQKQMYELQVDQMVQGQTAMLDEQRNVQLLGLQQEAMNQKIGLENQAAGLKLEYQQRLAQEEMMFKQYELQQAHFKAEQTMMKERSQQAASQTPAVPPPGAMFLPSYAAPAGMPQPQPGMVMMQGPPMPMEAMQMSMSMGALPAPPMMLVEQGPTAASYAAPVGYANPSYAIPAQAAAPQMTLAGY